MPRWSCILSLATARSELKQQISVPIKATVDSLEAEILAGWIVVASE